MTRFAFDTTPHIAFLPKDPGTLQLEDYRAFFADIPEYNWKSYNFGSKADGACCAQGHLGRCSNLGDDVEIAWQPGRVQRAGGHVSDDRHNEHVLRFEFLMRAGLKGESSGPIDQRVFYSSHVNDGDDNAADGAKLARYKQIVGDGTTPKARILHAIDVAISERDQ